MIFGCGLIGKVLSGRKTVTRRRLSNDADGEYCRYQAGHFYAVQAGRGKHHVAHIYVRQTHVERLGAITVFEVQDEGFTNVSEFHQYWNALYGRLDLAEQVAVIRFELAPRCPRCREWP